MSAESIQQAFEARQEFSPADTFPRQDGDPGWTDPAGWGEPFDVPAAEPDPVEEWPALDLAACGDTKAPTREWMLADWMPLRKATLLTGEGAVGKSLLAQVVCTCVALGIPCLGIQTRHAVAAYATWEDDDAELWRRQEAICAWLGVPLASLAGKLHLVSFTEITDPFVVTINAEGKLQVTPRGRQIEAMIAQHGVGFLVLDNASQIAAIDHNAIEEVAPLAHWLNALSQRMNGATLLLHHPNKSGDDWLGSVAYTNQFRSRMLMARPEDGDDPDARVLTNPKANYSRAGGQIEFRWHNGTFVQGHDLSDDVRAEMDAAIKVNGENEAFLRCLRQRASEGESRGVGPSPGPNYAPAQFEGMAQAKGYKKPALKRAMDRLFFIGAIEALEVVRPGKSGTKTIIVEVGPNTPERSPERLPNTVPERPRTPSRTPPHTHSIPKGISGAAAAAEAPADDDDLDWSESEVPTDD